MNKKRCGECTNCKKLDRVRISVLRCCNPPFSHADDGVIQVWNDAVRDYTCLNPKAAPEKSPTS